MVNLCEIDGKEGEDEVGVRAGVLVGLKVTNGKNTAQLTLATLEDDGVRDAA